MMEQKNSSQVAQVADSGKSTAPTPRRIPMGVHLHKAGKPTLSAALRRDVAAFTWLRAVQIFTHNPQGFNKYTTDPELKAAAAEHGIRVNVHASYMAIPWKVGDGRFIKATTSNIMSCDYYGSPTCVLHIPRDTVENIVSPLIPFHQWMKEAKIATKIVLEMKALKAHPTMSMESPKKLNRLTDAIYAAGIQDSVRLCIDTAHIDAGRAPIRNYDDAKKYLETFDGRLIGLIHLNGNGYDSSVRAGDMHEVPLSAQDKIWGGMKYADTGCRAFVEYAMMKNIDIILEIHEHHSVESVNEFMAKVTAFHASDGK